MPQIPLVLIEEVLHHLHRLKYLKSSRFGCVRGARFPFSTISKTATQVTGVDFGAQTRSPSTLKPQGMVMISAQLLYCLNPQPRDNWDPHLVQLQIDNPRVLITATRGKNRLSYMRLHEDHVGAICAWCYMGSI